RDASASLCLIGPHGTGKSVLALHLASRYLADVRNAESDALVFYVSTDLSHPMADDLWTSFALDSPDLRTNLFGLPYANKEGLDRTFILRNRTPYGDAKSEENLAEFI